MTGPCLVCFRPLDNTESRWHRACSRRLFGNGKPPRLDLDPAHLEELAAVSVRRRETVPGVQKKLSVGFVKDPGGRRLTIAGIEGGYILKPRSPDYPSLPENESLTMRCAAQAGISTPPAGLIEMNDGSLAYITRRFDRADGRKIHCEDMAQLSGKLTEDKYRGSVEKVGRIVRTYSDRPGIDAAELFLRTVFCFVTGNADMHLKNYSLITDGQIVLSPAYDLLCTAIVIPQDKEESALTINGKKSNLRRAHFTELARALELNDKLTQHQFSRIIGAVPAFLDLIEASLLPRHLKDAYAAVVRERADRLV